METNNLSWLEVEARYQITERTALARSSHQRPRRPLTRWISPAIPRRLIGRGLIALGERLAGPQPVRQRSAA